MAKKMTKKEALTIACQTLNAMYEAIKDSYTPEQIAKVQDALTVLDGMHFDLDRATSPEVNAERRAKNAKKRAQDVAPVVEFVLDALAQKPNSTAVEVFEACKDRIPLTWTGAKVQYLLLNDLKNKVGKNEVKGKPNTYFLIG